MLQMKVLFASSHPYLPQIAGGAQSSTHELVLELTGRSHDVAVLAGLTGHGWVGLRGRALLKLTSRQTVTDRRLGYRIHRGWHPAEVVEEVVARERPDVAVLQSGKPVPLARAFLKQGVATALYLRNVENDDLGGDPRSLGSITYIANSRFTANRFKQNFGIKASVIPPLFRAELYRTQSSRENVTFINPHSVKGVDIAFAVAEKCPEIPFVFVEGWTLSSEEHADLRARCAALPNVTLRPRTRNMRKVYGAARIILVPSRWEEAFGRVVSEAHYSGIPVVAARRGGLPEAVGPGGVLVDPDDSVEHWVEAVRSLWHDAERYEALSRLAEAHSRRPELDRNLQVGRLIGLLGEGVQKQSAESAGQYQASCARSGDGDSM